MLDVAWLLFSSFLYSTARNRHRQNFLILHSSFSQHARPVSLSIMSHLCVWTCFFNMSLMPCLRVHAVHSNCLTLCWTGRLADSHRLCRHAHIHLSSVQRRKKNQTVVVRFQCRFSKCPGLQEVQVCVKVIPARAKSMAEEWKRKQRQVTAQLARGG